MVLFVVLRDGVTLDDELAAQIKRRIREDCSPRHVPNEVMQIEEVPRTLSGKVLEVPVKRILMGAPPQRGRERRLARQPALARLLRGAGKDAPAAVSLDAPAKARPARVEAGAHSPLCGVPARLPRQIYSPIERPTISFMISFAPP